MASMDQLIIPQPESQDYIDMHKSKDSITKGSKQDKDGSNFINEDLKNFAASSTNVGMEYKSLSPKNPNHKRSVIFKEGH